MMFGLVKQSTHDRAMAVKDAETQELIAKLRAELRSVCAACEDRVNDLMTENCRLTRALGVIDRNNEKLFLANADLIRENLRLKDEHKPFMHVTRGPGGRWTSLKSVGAGA